MRTMLEVKKNNSTVLLQRQIILLYNLVNTVGGRKVQIAGGCTELEAFGAFKAVAGSTRLVCVVHSCRNHC